MPFFFSHRIKGKGFMTIRFKFKRDNHENANVYFKPLVQSIIVVDRSRPNISTFSEKEISYNFFSAHFIKQEPRK